MHGNEQLAIIIPALRRVGAAIASSQLTGPTPCKDFTVGDVLAHMTGLASGFAPMFRGDAAPPVEPDGGTAMDRFDAAMAARAESTR